MEETNHHRKAHIGVRVNGGSGSIMQNSGTRHDSVEDSKAKAKLDIVASTDEGDRDKVHRTKSFYDKLKVFDKQELRYPNRVKSMMLRPLIFLTFPVIFYAGFSYGSNLIWFNVLNGTASLVLSNKPYGFSSSIVGLAYIAPLIGVMLA